MKGEAKSLPGSKNLMNTWTIGIDLGGTKISAGIVDITGKIAGEIATFSTEAWKSPEEIFKNITKAIDLSLKKSEMSLKNITGIGIGVPTVVEGGSILGDSDNLPTMGGFNLKNKLLEHYEGKKIIIENDANCFIIGEKLCGKAKNYQFCCGVTLGTGLGIGIILNNELYHGSKGWAGEMNHSPYKEYKNIEEILSGKGLSLQYEKLTGLKVEAHVIAEKTRQGDKEAKKTWKIFGEALGYALSYLVNILDPEIIVIGGSISKSYNCFIDFTQDILKEYTKDYSQLKVARAKHSNLSGVIGTGVLASQIFYLPL